MASEYKGLYVQFEGDSTKLTAALSDINAESRKAQGALRSVQNALKFDPKSTALLGEAVKAAGSKVDATKKRVDALKQAQDDLAASGDTTSAAYQRVTRELAQAEAYLKRDQKALADATYAASGFAKVSDGLENFSQKAKSLGEGMQAMGGKLTAGVTVPFAAVATAAVSSAVTIDSALTDVRKTTDLTEEQYESLKQGAIELSKTQPVDAATILSLEGLGAQLGWSDDKLQDFAQTVSGLDIATDMDADTAATNLAQFANITGMAQDQAENYASAIVGLGNNMATTESKISDMAMGMASAGTQAGMSQADILGFAAAAASLGMDAQAGGTAFSKTINEIGTQVSTNGKQLQNWASLAHMSVDDFKAAWQTDATGIFEQVIKGMADAKDSGQDLNVILSDLGITETRQSDLMRRLAGNSDLVTKAVGLSNDEWSKNTALQNEVDNRNQSLASKMDVLKNRVTAVAEELGGPLADAALAAIDAAKPLTDGIENAAKAFSHMSKFEQEHIIKLAAMATAAGPLISIAGKAVGIIGNVADGLSSAVKVVGEVKSATKVMGSFGDALEVLDMKGAAMAGGIGLAVAAVAALGTYVYGQIKTHNDLSDAISSVRDSADNAASALSSGARDVKDYADSSDTAAKSVEELTKQMQDHEQAMSSILTPAEDSISMLGQYQTVIDQLAGKGSASAEEMGKLNWAVDGLNQTLGTNYSAMDVLKGTYEDQDGAVRNLKDDIDALIQKKQDEARVDATKSLYTEALKNQMQAQKDATAAQKDYNEQWQKYYDMQMGVPGMTEQAAKANADLAMQQQGMKDKLDAANGALDAANEETSEWAEQMGIAQASCTDLGQQLEGFLNSTDGWASALSDTGFSLDEIAGACASAGISTEQLASMGADSFAQLASAAGGNIDTLIKMLEGINELQLDPKTFTINDDGTLTDVTGKVWDLQNMTIDGKEFTVNDDGTITIEQEGIDHLSASEVEGKSFTTTSNGTTMQETSEVQGLNGTGVGDKSFTTTSNGTTQAETTNTDSLNSSLDSVPGTYTATVDVSGVESSYSSIQGLLDKLGEFASGTWTAVVHAITGNASGGIKLNATGGVRYHADGYIATGPTWMDANNIVGEAGAEAIVPLTNRRYSQPFADTIAEGVAARLGSGGITYVLNFNGTRVNDGSAIDRRIEEFVMDLHRMGALNG